MEMPNRKPLVFLNFTLNQCVENHGFPVLIWVVTGTQAILQASDCFRAVSGTHSGVNLAGHKFFCPVQRAGVSEIGQTLFA
jgi:hypothetical protein